MQKNEVMINEVELRERLDVSTPTVARMRKDGMPCHWTGGNWRYDLEKVLAWTEAQGKEKVAGEGERQATAI